MALKCLAENALTHMLENLATLCLHKCGEILLHKLDLITISTMSDPTNDKRKAVVAFRFGAVGVCILKAECALDGDIFAAMVVEMDKELGIMMDDMENNTNRSVLGPYAGVPISVEYGRLHAPRASGAAPDRVMHTPGYLPRLSLNEPVVLPAMRNPRLLPAAQAGVNVAANSAAGPKIKFEKQG